MASSTRWKMGLVAAAIAFAAGTAFAQDPRDDRYDSQYPQYDDRQGDDGFDYAKVVDVEPLTRRVRVTTPVRECWDEKRYEQPQSTYNPDAPSRQRAAATLIGATIGAVIGHEIGHDHGHHHHHGNEATIAGAVIGGAIGHEQGTRRAAAQAAANAGPPREVTVERCETRYNETLEERVDGYRVTYVYAGRRQVVTLPHKPGDRIRVRVDVTPAE